LLLINNLIVDQRKILLTRVCYNHMEKRCSSQNLCGSQFSYRTQIFATATNLFLSCSFFYIAVRRVAFLLVLNTIDRTFIIIKVFRQFCVDREQWKVSRWYFPSFILQARTISPHFPPHVYLTTAKNDDTINDTS